jgi:hypothetical protein
MLADVTVLKSHVGGDDRRANELLLHREDRSLALYHEFGDARDRLADPPSLV